MYANLFGFGFLAPKILSHRKSGSISFVGLSGGARKRLIPKTSPLSSLPSNPTSFPNLSTKKSMQSLNESSYNLQKPTLHKNSSSFGGQNYYQKNDWVEKGSQLIYSNLSIPNSFVQADNPDLSKKRRSSQPYRQD